MIDLKNLTITRARESMEKGEFSAEDLTCAYLENIKIKNPELDAYLSVFDDAIDEARKIDEKRKRGEKLGALAGIPIAIKALIMVKGREINGASHILKGHIATYDATAITKLRDADAVLLGIANCDDSAMGASGENSGYGPTKNPLDISRVPGGSSSGSAAAVAGELALVALGSDTGGSIRQPAAFCGIVGLKPSYGAVSRYGLLALCSSFDQIAPLAKTVSDAEIVFNIIKGEDKLDSTSVGKMGNLGKAKRALKEKAGHTIGVPSDLSFEGCDPRVIANFKSQIKSLENLGYEIKDIKLPNIKYAVPVYYIILPAEASANLARYDGMRYGAHIDAGGNLLEDYMKTKGLGFGKEVRRRIILGTYVLSAGYYDAYYYQAMRVRELIKQDFARAFESVDAIITPTTAGPAFKLGAKSSDPLKMYLEDIFTAPANIAGLCAISVPCGTVNEEGKELPLGLQIIADKGCEDVLFSIGKKFLGEE